MEEFEELLRDLYGKYAPDADVEQKLQYVKDNNYGVNEFVKDFYSKYAPEENIKEKQEYVFKNYFPDQYEKTRSPSKPKDIDADDFENTQEKDTGIERFFGKNQVTDFFGDFYRAAEGGYHAGTSVNESFDLFRKGKNMTNEEVKEFVKRGREMEEAGQTDEMLEFSQTFSKLKDSYGAIGGTLLAWSKNPTTMAQYTTQSLVQMGASLLDSEEVLGAAAAASGAGALVGAGTGAALTAIGGPLALFGAGAGATGGAIGGFFGGVSGAMEAGMTTAQLLQESAEGDGLNWAKMNDEERFDWIRKATSNEKTFNDIKSKAIARGLTIGAIDGIVGAVSMGTGKIAFNAVAKSALSRSAGLASVGAVATLETTGGMASEYFGQKAAGQDYNLEEIMIEGFADKTFTGVTAIKSLGKGVPKYTLNNQKLNGKQFSKALEVMDDEAYANADIKIENSPAVQEFVDNRNENISIDQDINSKIADPKDRSEAIKLEKQKRVLENNKTESGKTQLAKVKEKIGALETKYENTKIDVTTENRKIAVANALDTKFERNFNKNLESVKDLANEKGLDIDINENEDTYFQKIADALSTKEKPVTVENVKKRAIGSDGAFVGKGKIFINKTQAKKVGAVTVASHEVLHPVLNALIGGVDAQTNLVKKFESKLNKKQKGIMKKAIGSQPKGTEYLTVFTDNFDAIMAEQNITQKISDMFKGMFVKLGYENINFETGDGIYNFLKEYSKSTREGKLSDRAKKAIDKAENKVDTKIGDVGMAGGIQKSQTSTEAQAVNDIYDKTADKTEAGFNIALKYRGMAESTFKSIRDGSSYTQDQIDKLNQNKDDIIAMMLYDKIPSQKGDSKARNVLGLVIDFVKEKQKYGNPAAYINTFFKNRSKEVVNYFVPDAIMESMNDAEGNIKTSVAKKASTETSKDQGPEARALTDFNDLIIGDETFVTSDIYKSIKDKVIKNITLLLSKNKFNISEMTNIIEKEVSNVIKAAQGKISKIDGEVVISKEYNNFVRDGYEGGVKSLPIRVIKDSYLNKLFPTRKLGKVDLQNKKENNPDLKKDSNYRIDKLEIKKPTIGKWITYFTEGGYTTLLAKQKKYATEIAKAVSLKATREILTDPIIFSDILAKSSLRNDQITAEIVEGVLNTLETTLDTKAIEATLFDDIQFSHVSVDPALNKMNSAELLAFHIAQSKKFNTKIPNKPSKIEARKTIMAWAKGDITFEDLTEGYVKDFIDNTFIKIGISPENVGFVSMVMKSIATSGFQRIGNIWRTVSKKTVVDPAVMKEMKDEAQKIIDLIPGELLEVIGINWLGVHYRGINWTAAETKAIIKKAKNNKLSVDTQKLFDKINTEHISKHVEGGYGYKLSLRMMAETSLDKQKQILLNERVGFKLANEANSALTDFMAALIEDSKVSDGYKFNMLQLQTNIVEGFRAFSTIEAMYMEEGVLVPPLTKDGNLIKPPTSFKTVKKVKIDKPVEQYKKEMDAYFAKWEATKYWSQELGKIKKQFPKLSLVDQKKKTIQQLTPKNEHLFPNAISMAKLFLALFSKNGFNIKAIQQVFSEHKTLYAPKWVCDLIDIGGKTNQAGSRRVFLLESEIRNNIFATENGRSFQDNVIEDTVSEQYSKTDQTNSDQFNKILEETKGVDAFKVFSNAAAKSRGAKKGLYDYFIPPTAEDFVGLLYKFLGKGDVGVKQLEFFKEKLTKPFGAAMAEIDRRKQRLTNEYSALKKRMPGMKKLLGENTGYNEFTYDSAVRVYLWTKAGFDVPGLSKRDQTELVKKVKENADLKLYADSLAAMSNIKDNWTKPTDSWLTGNIPSDLSDISQKVNRKELLAEWVKNKNEIFSKDNLNKIEATYGTEFRESLEEILGRMERGSNRPVGSAQNKMATKFMNWVNNSVGAIMFINVRSSVLQTISMINFINIKDNNIFAAAKAFANQKQFWSDFTMLFNSDFLKQRRSGLKTDVNEAELANAVGTAPNKAAAAFKYMLKKGFLPTQIADSFAIAMGGASFVRNRVQSLIKSGMTKQEAMDQAMLDFREISEEAQQSSRPDRISSQQAGPLGRVILAFANTPMQYARLQKKAILDIKNGRGDWKAHMSTILYYGIIQNFIFNALQQALFAMAFDDDDEKLDEKQIGIMNGMADSLLRGTGVAGAGVATIKNMVMELIRQNKKSRPDYVNVALKSTSISPPISSKLTKLVSAARTFQWNGKEIMEEGLSLDNPANLAVGKTVSAFTNIPLDRLIQKIDNLKTATEEETAAWQSVALALGWDQWSLGLNQYQKKDKKSKTKVREIKRRPTGKSKTREIKRRK